MPGATRPARGFTLLEMLVVVAIVAIASAGVGLSLRDSQADLLEREAVRLAAVLEAARAQSRATGLPLQWRPRPGGFELVGPEATAASPAPPPDWADPELQAQVLQPLGQALQLGPEPLLPPQTVRLQLGTQSRWVGSDGLGPFQVQTSPEANTP